MSDVFIFVLFVASCIGCVWACVSLGKAIYKKVKSRNQKPAEEPTELHDDK